MRTKLELNYLAIKLRNLLKEDEYSYIDLFAAAKQIQYLTIVLYPFSEHISGMCIKQKDANLIAINSNMSYGRQRFSLAHELYHLFYDEKDGTTITNMNYDENSLTEKEANIFASCLIAPYNSLRDKLEEYNYKINEDVLIKLEQYFGFSHMGLLTRLLSESLITKEEYDKYSNINLTKSCYSLGYDNKLYLSNNENELYGTFGYYLIQANKLKEKGKISDIKYHELLLDAYRSDLVYSNKSKEVINDWYLLFWYRLSI